MEVIIEIRRHKLGVHENPDDPSELTEYTRVWYSNGTDITFLDSMTRMEDGKKVTWANVGGHSPLPPVRH